jgi:RimJ/RimL family protein N-acetyltransferase
MEVKRISKEDWAMMSENAHLICFDEKRPSFMDRIDFALLNVRGDKPLSYCTVRELDAESCYWQYGGAFPNTKGSTTSYHSYRLFADWCFANGYDRITTYIENINTAMIKIALKVGFLIVGVRTFKNKIYAEFLLEKGEA